MNGNENVPVFEDNGPVVLQDENTSEAILYGPAYSWIKNVLWIWDEIEEYLRRKADSLDSQIIDRKWSYYIMTRNPYLVEARSPPVNEVDRLNDLFTLRALCRCHIAIRKLSEYRKQNIAWARMKGVENYVKGMDGRGISESEWGIANSGFAMEPVNFDTVHGTGPAGYPEEDVDYRQALMDILGPEEYGELEERILGKIDEEEDYGEPEDAEAEPEEESGGEKEIPGTEESGDMSFIDELKDILEDPVKKAMESLETVNDECSAAAVFWDDMDIDGRRIIEGIIACAEA